MQIGFVINDVRTEHPRYTTTQLGITAARRGHEVFVIDVSDFACAPNGRVLARARKPSRREYESGEAYLADLTTEDAAIPDLDVTSLDILMLRNDPAEEHDRPWAREAGITFGRLAASQGVIVLNDPAGLTMARNKKYLQYFPEDVRPRTLITREPARIKAFAREQGGPIILKPLAGSGGQNVFMARPGDSNLNQMIAAVRRDGYVIAQEYIPAAEQGDIRVFMMNGQILEVDGKYAAFRRTQAEGDIRSNMHAGGKASPVDLDDRIFRLSEMVRPRLVQDGMFLVGVDVIGDKIAEINVCTPGGLATAGALYGVDFTAKIIEALERKAEYVGFYHRAFDNVDMATL